MNNYQQHQHLKRTKIITTIGPATDSLAQLKALFEHGMNTIRLNFSHGNHEEQGRRIDWAKQLMIEIKKPISIMLDTKGPEIRIGKMQNGQQIITQNSPVRIYTTIKEYQIRECGPNELTVSFDMSQDLKTGDVVLVDDGKLQLNVIKVQPGIVETIAFNKHILKTNKRVNLPGVVFSLPFLSEKDRDDIKFGVEKGIDYIAASFVNTAADITEIKKLLTKLNASDVQIIAKIESQTGINNIDAIIAAADGIMVARGDLGLEIPYYDVPYWEKVIIRKCRKAGKISIVATQMLESMTDNPSPTRAEVTDVYFATELGADATMLSGESANGTYPTIATEVMATINKRAEVEFYSKLYYEQQLQDAVISTAGTRAEIGQAIAEKCKSGDYSYVIVASKTGELLKTVSKFRPNTAILGISSEEKLYTKFGCFHSIFMNQVENYETFITSDQAIIEVAKNWGAKTGCKVLFVHKDKIRELSI